ncbi:ATP-binding protein [Bacillus sp. FJAT-28004]|uniref:ATP-binding protein n=1 Tax=Bacillus sp. FJAT-28004 TaxID=1679165 RepID=UPI0006B53B04|nr:ATP-binding protein [Bacillus sp. FJAT-28004]
MSSVLKELLLQFIVSLLPVFAFQLWYDKDQRWKGIPIFMSVFCGGSMMLCMLTGPNLMGYEVDFRLIPYVIGSLYGGLPTLAVLTIIYTAVRIPMLDSSWEMISFIILVVAFVPFMLLSIPSFKRSTLLGKEQKERKGLLIISILIVYYIASFTGFMSSNGIWWSNTMVYVQLLYIFAALMATWLSIFMIENVKEKQQLYEEVKRMSVNYSNEVEKLQQFIDETSFGVIIVDREGKITHFNATAKTVLSLHSLYTEDTELIGTSFPLIFQDGHGDACINLLSLALDGKKNTLVPYVNGDKTLVLTTISLRSSFNDENAGAALIAQDVTELHQLQSEVGRMERLSLVGQMAASITHEIRNPMAVIRGFVQLIQERSPKNQEEYFKIVIEELDRANMIISDFLSLAQNRDLAMELISLHDVVNELIPLLSADANLRGQSIEVSLCEDLPLIMMNDREIKQLFLNIARNGMEAMDNKGSLHISTRYYGNKIELRIADQGVGIPPEQMQHLFEPFFSTKTQGTGLGLPLCLSIAERHNGRIDVESKEGEGTAFIVTFDVPMELAG